MWLESQNSKILKYWIEHTSAPKLVSMSDGRIIWINDAFVELLGWSRPELCGKMTWMDITADENELNADMEMVQEVIDGVRTRYQLQKLYKTKNGPPKRVLIDVLRYPQSGDLEVCLVTAMPIEANLEYIIGQITTIQQILNKPKENKLKDHINNIFGIIENNPKATAIIMLIIAVVFFGDQVLEVVRAVGSIL